MNDPTIRRGLLVGCCDDDPEITRLIEESLAHAGHRTVLTHTGAEATSRFTRDPTIDVLLLDTGLPDLDGRDLCRSLRANGQLAPVMFLSDFGDPHEIVQGFAAGGLAHLVKPFTIPELVIRVESLARRTARPRSQDRSAVRIDPARHALVLGDRARTVTPTELRIAAELLANPGQVVTRTALVDNAWFTGAQVAQNTIDTYVHRIRRHLDQLGSNTSIKTVRGTGYILTTDPASDEPEPEPARHDRGGP